MSPLRVLLAEDHTLVRAGIRALLESLEGVEVVAEAADGREALRLAQTHHPDILLMDITMKELNGLEAAARLAKERSSTRVIILSMHADQAYVHQALQAGARGYLLKGADLTELELALKAVARGDTYLSPAVSTHFVGDLLNAFDGMGGDAGVIAERAGYGGMGDAGGVGDIFYGHSHQRDTNIKWVLAHVCNTRVQHYNMAE